MKKCNIDILEEKTKEGKFYLSVVVDKQSRYVLGHAFGKEMEFEPGICLGLFPDIRDYLRHNKQNTYDEAVEVLERFIVFYNNVRIHDELGWPPQVELLGKGKYSKEFLDWLEILIVDDKKYSA